MRLLVYSHDFAPQIGGIETIVLSLCRGLAELRAPDGQQQFKLTVVTQTPAGNHGHLLFPFDVVRQPRTRQLWRLIQQSDVLHVVGPAFLPLLLGLLARKPVVIEHHGFQAICPNGQLLIERTGTPCPGHFMAGRHVECVRCNCKDGWFASVKLWLFTFVRRFLCCLVAANITPTQWLGTKLHLPRIATITHGLESRTIPSDDLRSKAPPVIAFQGRLVSTKGLDLLFRAARILHDQNRSFELLIIGTGPERDSLHQLASDLGLAARVNFAGVLPPEQLEAALARAMIVAVPSLAGEVFGLVIAENMQRAHAVVASDLGSFVEVLGDAGLTFRTGDASDLASKLARLLDDPALARHLGQVARKRVCDYFQRGWMIERHAHLYHSVSSNKIE